MPPLAKKLHKPVFKTDTPFTKATWYGTVFCIVDAMVVDDKCRPPTSHDEQEVILDLACKSVHVCSILSCLYGFPRFGVL